MFSSKEADVEKVKQFLVHQPRRWQSLPVILSCGSRSFSCSYPWEECFMQKSFKSLQHSQVLYSPWQSLKNQNKLLVQWSLEEPRTQFWMDLIDCVIFRRSLLPSWWLHSGDWELLPLHDPLLRLFQEAQGRWSKEEYSANCAAMHTPLCDSALSREPAAAVSCYISEGCRPGAVRLILFHVNWVPLLLTLRSFPRHVADLSFKSKLLSRLLSWACTAHSLLSSCIYFTRCKEWEPSANTTN